MIFLVSLLLSFDAFALPSAQGCKAHLKDPKSPHHQYCLNMTAPTPGQNLPDINVEPPDISKPDIEKPSIPDVISPQPIAPSPETITPKPIAPAPEVPKPSFPKSETPELDLPKTVAPEIDSPVSNIPDLNQISPTSPKIDQLPTLKTDSRFFDTTIDSQIKNNRDQMIDSATNTPTAPEVTIEDIKPSLKKKNSGKDTDGGLYKEETSILTSKNPADLLPPSEGPDFKKTSEPKKQVLKNREKIRDQEISITPSSGNPPQKINAPQDPVKKTAFLYDYWWILILILLAALIIKSII